MALQCRKVLKWTYYQYFVYIVLLYVYCYYECIDIEYDNKVIVVLNVYAYYFKTKSQTLFKLCVCIPSCLHIVGLKWITKILMG